MVTKYVNTSRLHMNFLFTNIPTELTLELIKIEWYVIKENANMTCECVITLFKTTFLLIINFVN